MSDHRGESAAVLAAVVGPTAGPMPRAARSLHRQHVEFVRGLLTAFGGIDMQPPSPHPCYSFETWHKALDAGAALIAEASQLTTRLAGLELRVGLDLTDEPADRADLDRALTIASSAGPNEIRLGQALATVARHDPPDHRVVKRVADPGLGPGELYCLAIARHEIPNNLAPALTSFVGREAEIHQVRQVLARTRLLTLTGPPGTGKTRLARQIAERVLGRYDGVWFVELAPLTDPQLILSALAEALGLRPAGDRPIRDAITAHLEGRRVLAIFDNFEHVTGGATDLVQLLAASPGLHAFVTSRVALHVAGEQEYQLTPLNLPRLDTDPSDAARVEAVDLFARRAAAAQPTFIVQDDNAADVAELCRRVDGLPLAIELAAARVKLLPVPAILSRLDHRLALLTDGPRDAPSRHKSLRAAVAWSYDLLDPTAQALFRRLSVFRGGWTIEGASAVSGESETRPEDVLSTLGSLLDASLLVHVAPETADTRFSMLETLREFVAERLEQAGESDAVRTLHAAWCLGLVERNQSRFTGPAPAEALDAVSREHENIRIALEHLLASNPEDALRLAAWMWRFWQMRGYLLEGSRWLARALEVAGEDVSPDVRASALSAAGGLAYWRNDLAETRRAYEAAVDLRRGVGDGPQLAGALYDLAFTFQPEFNPPPEDPEVTERGLELVEEAQRLYVAAKNEPGIAKTAWLFGNLMLSRDIQRARDLLRASVEQFRGLNDPFGLGSALFTYGLASLGCSDSGGATAALRESLRLFAAMQDGSPTGLLLTYLGEAAVAEGDVLRGSRLKGAAARARQVTEAELTFASSSWLVSNAATLELVDPAALESAWADGYAMSQTEAIAFALTSDVASTPDSGLRVSSLGRFDVERRGQPVSHWGGAKAGSRHAQAMFAFLLDRGEQGVTKDEFIEVIWPDADLEQGDLNFHRTLGGLRDTLEPGGRHGSGTTVRFGNGRYRLDPAFVVRSDAADFERLLLNAGHATDDAAAIRGLEAARTLYHGDYLDDCPLYGDSTYVEDRRRFLRGRMTDALVDLGRRYESRGDATLAAARFREAMTVSGGECTAAADGLERLGVQVA